MKFRILSLLLAALLLVGCSSTMERLDAAEDMVEDRVDAVEDRIEEVFDPDPAPPPVPTPEPATAQTSAVDTPAEAIAPDTAPAPTGETAARLTREEAEAIALEYAGFTADQVTFLHTEYEIDDGRPQYEVEFHQGRWEYSFEIDAETGKILSYDKDD